MKKILFTALLSCSLISARATLYTFQAYLSTPSSIPPLGFSIVNFDDSANTLEVLLAFSGLTGTTTAAHIHAPTVLPLTGTAGIAVPFTGFPVGVTSGVYSNSFDLTASGTYNSTFFNVVGGGTAAGSEAALLSAMLSGSSYVNIHTTTFPAGEIHGFLTLVPVPEPTTFSLLGLCGAVFGGRMLKRKSRTAIS